MITALVLGSLAALLGLCMSRLLRPMPPPACDAGDGGGGGGGHPESMTAELDPLDEEYLAWLADALWPEDEYLEPEPFPDGDGDAGGSVRR